MTNAIEPTIREFIQSLPSTKDTITNTDDILSTGVLDSLSIAKLLAFLESEFGLTIPFDEVTVEEFSTTTDISQIVAQRLETT